MRARVEERLVRLRLGAVAQRLDGILSAAARAEPTYLDFLDQLLAEETDALIIVVSEETQEISVVRQGTITPFHDEEGLRAALTAICLPRPQTPRWRTLLNTLRPDHARKA